MLFRVVKKISVIIFGFSLSACLPAEIGSPAGTSGVVAASDPVVAANFDGGSIRWNNDGVMVYRFTAIERAGEVFLCGAYSGEGRSYTAELNRELLRRSAATVNGEEVLRNLAFFSKASAETIDTGLEGSETRCKSIGVAAGSVALEDVDVELRRGRIRIRV